MAVADLTGDEFAEVVAVSLGDASSPSQLATTMIVYGQWAYRDTIFFESDTTLTRINDASIGDYLGIGVVVSDFNRDGVNDLVLGADWADALGRLASGKIYIFHGSESATGIAHHPPTPTFAVYQNRPNPFSSTTSIPYWLSRLDLWSLLSSTLPVAG